MMYLYLMNRLLLGNCVDLYVLVYEILIIFLLNKIFVVRNFNRL